jgi:Uma2 family endonuclease
MRPQSCRMGPEFRLVRLMNVHLSQLPPLMTVADFLDWPGDGTDTRYELIDGVLRAMSPGSDAHNMIITNFSSLIWIHLRNQSRLRVITAPGVQPHVRADWNFRIPDIGVTAMQNVQGQIMMPDPILLIEVLSPGNANDTFENVRAYSTLPSVQEILVVQSTKIGAELLRRGSDGNWPANPAPIGASDPLSLTSIGFEVPLVDLYAGTYLG